MTDGPVPGPTTAAAQWNDVEQLFSRPGEVWSVTCFVVTAGHRRSGVAAAPQCAAVEHAKLNGRRCGRRPGGPRAAAKSGTRRPPVVGVLPL
jgi:hypothetical protein